MEASKGFIKNAVGILIVVAVCLVAVTIYKKGNDSINASMSEYDEIVSQFENVTLRNYENTTVSGSQIVDLLKSLEKEDDIKVLVSNGYTIKNKLSAQEYDYNSIHSAGSTMLKDISDKSVVSRYINPTALFSSSITYDENAEIAAVVFKQE